MTFVPAGLPDYTAKGIGPVDYLGVLDVNAGMAGQAFDITNLITPAHVGLYVVWVASFASAGQGIIFNVGASLNSVLLIFDTELEDGGEYLGPFPGVYITENAGTVATLTAIVGVGDPSPVTGKLVLFGLNATPMTVPVIRRHLIGRGQSSPVTNVATGATGTILAAPRLGRYYRIKALSWWVVAAPAAVARVTWNVMSGGVGGAAAGQHNEQVLDVEWDAAVTLFNGLSVTISAIVTYEVWPV